MIERYPEQLQDATPKDEVEIHAAEAAVPTAVTEGFTLSETVSTSGSVDVSFENPGGKELVKLFNSHPVTIPEVPTGSVFDAKEIFRMQDDGNFPQKYNRE